MSHPPHLLGVGTSALIPFCAFKSDPIISDNPQWIQGLSFPVCSSFQQTILEDQLCYKLQLNRRSGVGKKNQLLLLLDYNEDLSMQVPLNSSDSVLEPTRLNMEQKGAEEGTKAKIQVNTLSPIIGFGGGSFKLTAVKRMTATADFLKMSLDDRDCEVELYEDCRTWNLIQECGCVPSEMTAVQVYQAFSVHNFSQEGKFCTPKGRDCIEKMASKNFNCSIACEGIFADAQWNAEAPDEDTGGTDAKNLMGLMKEYKEFKKVIRHFRFDANKTTSTYGENAFILAAL